MKVFCLAVFLALSAACHGAVQWQTDLPTALKQAAAENKAVLVDFTGSDWCGWCIKLKREVFDQKEFQAFAQENLVLVEVDFPNSKPQSAALRNANAALAKQFGIEGYPTIFILDANGNRLLKTGYKSGGPKNYISHIMSSAKFAWRKPEPQSGQPNTTSQSAPAQPPKPKPNTPPVIAVPYEIRYDELALKAISGGARKTAMINNQTFAEHETANVKLGDKRVTIECKEIREKSVLIQIQGESQPRELKLKETPAKQESK